MQKGKGRNVILAVLSYAGVKFHRPSVKTGGSAGLKSSYVKPQIYKAFGQFGGGGKAVWSALLAVFARNRFGIQIYARCKNNGFCLKYPAVRRFYSVYLAVFNKHFGAFALHYMQVRRVFKRALHLAVIGVLVALAPQRLNGFALVQHSYL